MILYFGGEDFRKKLKRYRFIESNRRMSFLVYVNSNSQYASKVMKKANWYVLEGDVDI
jgi:hypothetical protein